MLNLTRWRTIIVFMTLMEYGCWSLKTKVQIMKRVP